MPSTSLFKYLVTNIISVLARFLIPYSHYDISDTGPPSPVSTHTRSLIALLLVVCRRLVVIVARGHISITSKRCKRVRLCRSLWQQAGGDTVARMRLVYCLSS